MGDFIVHCNSESRRRSCMIMDSDKINQIIVNKQARTEKNSCDFFLTSLFFAKEQATVTIDNGEQQNQQLEHLVTEFADMNEEDQELLPHRGHLDNK